MSEYVPSVQLRAGSSCIAADFIAHADSILSLDSLTARFSEALGLDVASHGCFEIAGEERRFLFGKDGWCGPVGDGRTLASLCFPILGWDGRQYEMEFRLFSQPEADERANLHAMAVLYLCRGIALRDARDDLTGAGLTATERYCLDQRQAGWCDLDIAEELDRSVQAVKIHLQRAEAKLRA